MFTRQNLYQIVRNDNLVKQIAGEDEERIKSNVNTYITHLVNIGLPFFDSVKDVQESGRPEHAYSKDDLSRFNSRYLENVKSYTTTLRKAIALSLKKHFDFLNEVSEETREEQLKKYIFGSS